MEPRIEEVEAKRLIGMSAEMTLSDDHTADLWRKFMLRRLEVGNRQNGEFISMQIYDSSQGQAFTPDTRFVKWAAVEVTDHENVPEGMEPYTLRGGTYAVFVHKGPASTFAETLQYIFGVWLPNSGYTLDDREHFEVLGEHYLPNDPEAEEEVFIPIRIGATALVTE